MTRASLAPSSGASDPDEAFFRLSPAQLRACVSTAMSVAFAHQVLAG